MLQILLIMLFRTSLKIPHYAHYYSFNAPHCYYYSIHRRWKGWGYGAAAPPQFKGTP